MKKPPLMTVADVALRLSCSEYNVREQIKRKDLRAIKVGRNWKIEPDDLQSYIDARANLSKVRRSA